MVVKPLLSLVTTSVWPSDVMLEEVEPSFLFHQPGREVQ